MSAYSLTITTTLADSDVGQVETADVYSATYISPGMLRHEEVLAALKDSFLATFGDSGHGLSHTWGDSFYEAMMQDIQKEENWMMSAIVRDMRTNYPAFYVRITFTKVEVAPDPISVVHEQCAFIWGHSK